MTKSIGLILLCIFLIVHGLLLITNIQFQLSGFVLGVSAIAAAIFLAIGK